MTDAEIDALTGRELDAQISLCLFDMPAKITVKAEYHDRWTCLDDDDTELCELDYYSSNISSAWEVVDRMEERGHILNMARIRRYAVHFSPDMKTGDWSYADDAPTAICRAALRAHFASEREKPTP